MRKQYYFRPSRQGYCAWDIDRLVELSKDFKTKEIFLDTIKELDENFWFGMNGDVASCRAIVDHMRLIHEVDLSCPIILCPEGRVMDGMHRVAKALYKDKETIRAVQFEEIPVPDYEDVYPDDLPYD